MQEEKTRRKKCKKETEDSGQGAFVNLFLGQIWPKFWRVFGSLPRLGE
jgi:hypothetical protein